MRFIYLHNFKEGVPGRPVTVVVGHPEPAQGLLEYLDDTYPISWLRLEGIYSSVSKIRPYNEQIDSYVDELLKAGVRDIVLVGYSIGGMLVAGIAARLKGRVNVHHTFLIEPSLPGLLPFGAKPKIRMGAERTFFDRVVSFLIRKCQLVYSDVRTIRSRAESLWIWEEFSKQLTPLAKAYEHKGSFGPSTLIGSKFFLKVQGRTWSILNAPDSLRQHAINTHTHESPILRAYAPQWMRIVKAKIDECSGDELAVSEHKGSKAAS